MAAMDVDPTDEVEEVMDNVPYHITDGLYLGSSMAEMNIAKLKQAGITHILTVCADYPPSHPSHFVYKHIEVQDACNVDLLCHCGGPNGAFAFIDAALAAEGSVFVHCMAGVSRSSTVVIGWLMKTYKLSFDEGFRRVHAIRPWICPNPGFRLQLERMAFLQYDLSRWEPFKLVIEEDTSSAIAPRAPAAQR